MMEPMYEKIRSEQFNESPAASDSPVDLWEHLAVEESTDEWPRAVRHQEFWDSLSTSQQSALAERCPYFDPSHQVWSEKDSSLSNAAFRELTQIMVDDRRGITGTSLKRRVLIALVASLVCGAFALALMVGIKKDLETSVLTAILICVAFSILSTASLIGVALYGAWKVHKRAPKLIYTPVAEIARARANGIGEPLSQVADYERNWAVTEHWKKFSGSILFSSEGMWLILSTAVDEGGLTKRGRRQVFWDVLSPKQRALMVNLDARFDPSSEIWNADDGAATRKADLELELRLLDRSATKARKILCCYLLIGAVIFMLSFKSRSLIPTIGGVAPNIVLGSYEIWSARRKQAKLRHDFDAASSA